MSEQKPRGSDTRPKSGLRSWSADSYVWRAKKRSRSSHNETAFDGRVEEGAAAAEAPGGVARSTSCPRRRRDRKCSCGGPGEGDADAACRKPLSRRSLRQKFQDAVGQCLPLRSHHHHHHHHHHHRPHPHPHPHPAPGTAPSRPFSVLVWSKRKIHVSELMQDKCPFSPKSELAHCWHLIKKHTPHPGALKGVEPPHPHNKSHASSSSSCSPPPTPLSWEDVCCSSPGTASSSLEDWDPSCPHGAAGAAGAGGAGGGGHTDYILVPDLLQINNSPCYWGVLNRFEAEALLEGQPEGTFLLRDSAQDEFLFSVSFRRYSRSLHARIEQSDKRFSFDGRDPCMYRDPSVTGLLRHYSDPASCLYFEPLLSRPLSRTFPFSLQHLCRAVVCSCTTYQGVQGLPLPPQLRDFLGQYHFKCDDGGACSL